MIGTENKLGIVGSMSRKTVTVSNCRLTEEAEVSVAHGADHGVTSRPIRVAFTDRISARWADTRESTGGVESPRFC